MTEIFNFLEFYVFIIENELEKMKFPLGKMDNWINWKMDNNFLDNVWILNYRESTITAHVS